MIDLSLGTMGALDNTRPSEFEYGPRHGSSELVDAVADWTGNPPDCVTITSGASLALVAGLSTLKSPRGAVLCPVLHYPAYPRIIAALGFRPEYYSFGESPVRPSRVQAIIEEASAETSAILWNFPHNPSGATDLNESYSLLLELCARRNILVLADRVYGEFMHGREHWSWGGTAPHDSELRIGSFSKIFALAGERVGFVVTSPNSVSRIAQAHWSIAMSVSASGQQKALAKLRNDPHRQIARAQAVIASNSRMVHSMLGDIPGVVVTGSDGSMFAWVEFPRATIPGASIVKLFLRRNVVVMPGESFGSSMASFRINLGASEELLRRGAEAIRVVLQALVTKGLV